jgi:formate hydrogenlyase subunit 6/NADH:ubiquinone oxidoreductase subunit I
VKQGPGRGLATYIGNVIRSATSTFEGLAVTMSWMFRRPLTIQYPNKIDKPVQEMLPDTYRGVLEADVSRCSGCLLCARACPVNAIVLEVGKNTETGGREITRFDIDIGLCMYCGLCAEQCAFDSLAHTTEFEATTPCRDDLVLHFVTTPVPVSRNKAGEGPARAKKGSIVTGLIPSFGRRKKGPFGPGGFGR